MRYHTSPSISLQDVASREAGYQPWRRSHAAGQQPWVDAGWGADDAKAYAQAVLDALQTEPPVTDSGVERTFQAIRAAAQETIRRAGSPVKIGVVGEFNAGKSLLLGGLIGYADALPISEVPTTGNVTALFHRGNARVEAHDLS